jgi:hypothetical protein
MNKITLVIALGIGLTLGLAAPSAQADPIVQQLATPSITAAQFNSMFTPATDSSGNAIPVNTSNFQFDGAPVSGTIQSQVFTGTGADAGLTAYAYQIGVNNVSDGSGEPVQVNSASFHFGSTPITTKFPADSAGPAATGSAFVVTGGAVGGLSNQPQGLSPTSLAWQPGTTVGSLTAQFLDAKSNAGPIMAGNNSAVFVVITDTPNYTKNLVSVQSPDPPISATTTVLAPTGGTISPVPAPEPTTVLAWTGVLGGIALVRHVRKNRIVLA